MMDNKTQNIIDGLFERLEQAEKNNPVRDNAAQSLIEKHLVAHPAAPYYMAQTMIMQEATIKQLNAKIEALQQQTEQNQKSSGGFFSDLFGGNNQSSSNTSNRNTFQNSNGQPNYGQAGNQYSNAANRGYGGYNRGSSFLGGALQTAAGVAGGVVLGNLMMDMFSHHHPEEIVNIINEEPMQDMGSNADTNFTDKNDNDADFLNDSYANSDLDPNDQSSGFDNSFTDSPFAGDSDNTDGGFFGGGDGGFDDFDDWS
ncbi:DUF2076 domain-containing protein [Vibrio sp.]|nr:DUF2076 domain-containing protein [Vibrio sp.]